MDLFNLRFLVPQMTISELRRQFYVAKSRNLKLEKWIVSQDEYDDLVEELRDLCTTATYIDDGSIKGMKIMGIKIEVDK